MFKLVQIRPEGSDCTAPYGVQLNGDYTVEQFINDVLLDEREFGYIGIYNGKSVFGDPRCEYRFGEIISTMDEKFLNMRVTSATASGGWGRMDYILTVEVVDGKFIEITENYGIRPENIFGDKVFAVYKNGEEDSRKFIAVFRNMAAAINECKYLERLFKKSYTP